ncbi:MAG: proteasome assembly chaperone family protein [Candidatus Altiarchaeales archaeon A3]|nr:MAG: proteasome assembly chaperone family protein [Candidatus Altiarchaeales archaeon A3]
MEDVIIKTEKRLPKLKDAIMIAGFPGIGFVGKICVDQLVEDLKPIKFATVYSPYFPPQIIVNFDGTVRMPQNEIYYWKNKKGKNDLILATGDFQGVTGDSQYKISDAIIEIAKKANVQRVYTLGGLGTGAIPKKPRIFGAATSKELIEELKKLHIDFRPGGGIFGAAGLMVGLCMSNKIDGVCLMGETQGEFLDAKASEAVLKIISQILDIKVNFEAFSKKVTETEKNINEIKRMIEEQKRQLEQTTQKQEDLNKVPLVYIR